MDKKVFDQIFNTCDWKFPSFLENFKYVNAYQELLELFIEYNVSHSENDESQLSIYPDIVSKEKVWTLLIHQLIINNVLPKNQPLKKRKYIKKIDETLFTQILYNNWLWKFNHYKYDRNVLFFLRCSSKECDCGKISNILDN